VAWRWAAEEARPVVVARPAYLSFERDGTILYRLRAKSVLWLQEWGRGPSVALYQPALGSSLKLDDRQSRVVVGDVEKSPDVHKDVGALDLRRSAWEPVDPFGLAARGRTRRLPLRPRVLPSGENEIGRDERGGTVLVEIRSRQCGAERAGAHLRSRPARQPVPVDRREFDVVDRSRRPARGRSVLDEFDCNPLRRRDQSFEHVSRRAIAFRDAGIAALELVP